MASASFPVCGSPGPGTGNARARAPDDVVATNRFADLDVYRAAIRYVGVTRPLVMRLRTGDASLADQLHRAVVSIPLNTAEGAGEFSPRDKARFYRYALRSCTETIAILDVCREIEIIGREEHATCHELGDRLVAMLTRLVIVTGNRERGVRAEDPIVNATVPPDRMQDPKRIER